MGNSETKNKNKETICKIDNAEFNFCSVNSKFKEKNELLLCKTYAYPKGTFTKESTKFLSDQEKYLLYFSQGSNIAAIRYITLKGVHINTLDQDRSSPLHIACRSASLQLVEEIISHGAMINIPDIVGWTPMHIACYYKRKEVILLLLKNQANLFFKDREGLYPYDLIDNDKSCVEAINSFLVYSQNFQQKNKYSFQTNDYEIKETEQNYESHLSNNPNLYKYENILIKYLYKQKMLSNKDEDTNFSFNEHNLMEFIKLTNANEKIMENYKFIPKKPKFYLNFKESQNIHNSCVSSSVSFKKNQLKNMKTNVFSINKYNPLAKSATINSLNKLNRSNTAFNNYNSINNLNKTKDLDNKFNNLQKFKNNIPISIKMPKAFPNTKNIGLLKKSPSAKCNGNYNNTLTLKEYSLDSEKTITYKEDTQENDNQITELYNKNSNESWIDDEMKENELNMKMLDSVESEDSFLIDFDISLNEDLININPGKKLKDRKVRHKSVVDKYIISEEDQKPDNEETFIQNNWDKDNSIIIEENYPVTQFHIPNPNRMNINEIILFNKSNKSKKIFINAETDYFLTKINLNSIIFKSFLLSEKKIENLFIKLFLCTPDFGLLFFLNIFDTQNEFDKLISILRTKNLDKFLLSLIIFNNNYNETDFSDSLLNNYIMSFEMSKTSVCESLHKILKNFTFSKDFILIDKFSKAFSKIFYDKLNVNNDTNIFNSENAIYSIVFILVVMDIDFKSKETVNFVDFMILVKYLNEGLNFNNEFLKSCYKFTKNLGFTNYSNNQISLNKNFLFLTKENKRNSKNYRFSYCDDWLLLFNNLDNCDKLIYIKNNNLYILKFDDISKTISIISKNGKKNILIFKYKGTYIKYNKYTKLSLKPDNYDEMKKTLDK